MPFPFATLVPIAGAITREVVQGINNRKARLYNSPANQIKRLREAGLPTAAGSNITGGQQVPTQVSGNFGTEGFNDNLGKSITRQIDRKKIELLGEEIRTATANADIQSGLSKWLGSKSENYLGSIQTNQAAKLDFEKSILESEEILKNNQQFISGIERDLKEYLRDNGYLTKEAIAKIDQVLAQTGLTNEQTSALSDQRKAREVILSLLKQNGMNVFESLAYMLITKYMGSGQ